MKTNNKPQDIKKCKAGYPLEYTEVTEEQIFNKKGILTEIRETVIEHKQDITDKIEGTTIIGDNNGWSRVNGKWVHRILTIKDNKIKFYKDGVLKWSKNL